MPRKAFQLQVELEIQAVSCPGVWLCPNGKVSIQLYMLDSCIQTTSIQPVFPLLIHENFIFYKTFHSAQSLTDLQKLLKKEVMYAELIQWQNCDVGCVLASFETTLAELLYPTVQDGAIAGVDVDLLMEPEKHFPGIIAPKIEVSTKTTIEERHCRDESKQCNAFVVNPKVLISHSQEKTSPNIRQRKVCHSAGYHRRQHVKKNKHDRPPFVVKKVQDDLLARKPKGLDHIKDPCKCIKRSKSTGRLIDKFSEESDDESQRIKENTSALPSSKRPYLSSKPIKRHIKQSSNQKCDCSCRHQHTQLSCSVCAKYRRYFNKNQVEPSPRQTQKEKFLSKCSKVEELCCCGSQNEGGDFQNLRLQIPRKCDCVGGCCGKLCFCPPSKSPSLAERIHERLNRTLGSCIECPYPEENLSTIYENNCPPDVECQCGNCSSNNVLDNFDKFYKNLYKTATCKSNDSSNRYITSCY